MTRLTQLDAHSTMADRHRARGVARRRRSFDGVVASYIRELSTTPQPAREITPAASHSELVAQR